MDTLFPVDPNYPPGFSYVPDFISINEEKELVDLITTLDLHPFLFHGFEAKRKVASYGHDYSFSQRTLAEGKNIPPEFEFLVSKVSAYLMLNPEQFAELLVTEYPVSSVINWHRDAPPFDIIAGISLLSDCTFRLRPHDKQKQLRGSILSIPVARRSLYILQGASRNDWQHSITPVKHLRYSITLRTLRPELGK